MITQRIIPTQHPYKANEFREGKLKLFEDFGITLTESERETFDKLETPRQIQKFVDDIYRDRLK